MCVRSVLRPSCVQAIGSIQKRGQATACGSTRSSPKSACFSRGQRSRKSCAASGMSLLWICRTSARPFAPSRRTAVFSLTHSPLGTAHPMECHSDNHGRPHASSWGKSGGHDVDWGHAAERIGNHVLSVCPRWLIMVEGVGYSPGALGMDSGSAGICTFPPGFERRVALCQRQP